MSHWMTSGRNRLKAKEDRSFSHRAQARAAFNGFKVKKRSRNDVKNIQHNHPRFHKRTAVQDIGSSWSCPIARRGIVVAAPRRGLDSEGHRDGQAPPPPLQPRRIRDPNASKYNLSSRKPRQGRASSYQQQGQPQRQQTAPYPHQQAPEPNQQYDYRLPVQQQQQYSHRQHPNVGPQQSYYQQHREQGEHQQHQQQQQHHYQNYASVQVPLFDDSQTGFDNFDEGYSEPFESADAYLETFSHGEDDSMLQLDIHSPYSHSSANHIDDVPPWNGHRPEEGLFRRRENRDSSQRNNMKNRQYTDPPVHAYDDARFQDPFDENVGFQPSGASVLHTRDHAGNRGIWTGQRETTNVLGQDRGIWSAQRDGDSIPIPSHRGIWQSQAVSASVPSQQEESEIWSHCQSEAAPSQAHHSAILPHHTAETATFTSQDDGIWPPSQTKARAAPTPTQNRDIFPKPANQISIDQVGATTQEQEHKKRNQPLHRKPRAHKFDYDGTDHQIKPGCQDFSKPFSGTYQEFVKPSSRNDPEPTPPPSAQVPREIHTGHSSTVPDELSNTSDFDGSSHKEAYAHDEEGTSPPTLRYFDLDVEVDYDTGAPVSYTNF